MISEFKVLHPRVHGSTLLHPVESLHAVAGLAQKHPEPLSPQRGAALLTGKGVSVITWGHRKRPHWMWLRIRVECTSCSGFFFSSLPPSDPVELESQNQLEVC